MFLQNEKNILAHLKQQVENKLNKNQSLEEKEGKRQFGQNKASKKSIKQSQELEQQNVTFPHLALGPAEAGIERKAETGETDENYRETRIPAFAAVQQQPVLDQPTIPKQGDAEDRMIFLYLI